MGKRDHAEKLTLLLKVTFYLCEYIYEQTFNLANTSPSNKLVHFLSYGTTVLHIRGFDKFYTGVTEIFII